MNEYPQNLQHFTLQTEVRAVKVRNVIKSGNQLTIDTDDDYFPPFNIDAMQKPGGKKTAIKGKAGDYLVVDAEGAASFMPADDFEATYKRVV